MKKLLVPGLVAMAAVMTLAAKAPKDPVLMTVDGRPVTLSEFEYLYHKNSDQQLQQETVDEYLQRFIDYKLKVAQARHEGRDTTATYRKELRSYRRDLMAPYLTDSVVEKQIIDEAVAHAQTEVKIDHIMLPSDKKALADSVRALAVADGTREGFLDLAKRYSVDPSLRQNGGDYGWVMTGQYPIEWEEAAFNTPVGQVSAVTETPYGYHLLRVDASRPASGEIRAAHILVSYDSVNGDTAAAKAKADSIYTLVTAGGQDFGDVAKRLSACPSSAQGGDLGFFARGAMVPEFEHVAFDVLNENGQISEPFTTRFGYHIVRRLGDRHPSPAALREEARAAIARDSRQLRPRQARAAQLRREYKTRVDEKGRALLLQTVGPVGFDSAASLLSNDLTPLFYVADSTATIADFLKARSVHINPQLPHVQQIDGLIEGQLNNGTMTYEARHLEEKYPEFRNVAREYAEGLMLFASMEDNVWNRPTTDPAGLEAYFRRNYDKYNDWESPRWKGYVIYATEDSVIRQVQAFLDENKPTADSLGQALKAVFPRNIKIERIVLPKGQNPLVDAIAFDGPAYEPAGRWKYYLTYLGHVIPGPEEAADVRGRVTADWIEALEKEWVDTLRRRYPVVIDKKVLKKVK